MQLKWWQRRRAKIGLLIATALVALFTGLNCLLLLAFIGFGSPPPIPEGVYAALCLLGLAASIAAPSVLAARLFPESRRAIYSTVAALLLAGLVSLLMLGLF